MKVKIVPNVWLFNVGPHSTFQQWPGFKRPGWGYVTLITSRAKCGQLCSWFSNACTTGAGLQRHSEKKNPFVMSTYFLQMYLIENICGHDDDQTNSYSKLKCNTFKMCLHCIMQCNSILFSFLCLSPTTYFRECLQHIYPRIQRE